MYCASPPSLASLFCPVTAIPLGKPSRAHSEWFAGACGRPDRLQTLSLGDQVFEVHERSEGITRPSTEASLSSGEIMMVTQAFEVLSRSGSLPIQSAVIGQCSTESLTFPSLLSAIPKSHFRSCCICPTPSCWASVSCWRGQHPVSADAGGVYHGPVFSSNLTNDLSYRCVGARYAIETDSPALVSF